MTTEMEKLGALPGCSAECTVRRSDVFCEHGSLLPRINGYLLTLCSIAIYGAYLTSAELRKAIPIFLAWMLIGAAAACLPLFREKAWRAILVGWCAVSGVIWGLQYADALGRRNAALILAICVTAAWLFRFLSELSNDARGGQVSPSRPNLLWMSVPFGVALIFFSGFIEVSSRGSSRLLPSDAREAAPFLLAIGLISLGINLITLAATALRQAGSSPPRAHARTISEIKRSKAPSNSFERVLVTVEACTEIAIQKLSNTMRLIVHAFVRYAGALVDAAIISYNFLLRYGITALRFTVVPIIGLAAASSLTLKGTQENLQYLLSGGLIKLAISISYALLSAAALTCVWVAIYPQPVRQSLASAAQSARNASPPLAAIILLGGWIVGSYGTFGPGQIHVGELTVFLTVIFGLAIAVHLILRRKGKR
ncbi:hypothetical protein ACFY0P_42670 [Streptomyces sp. NPDC001714]|uniref:hypothetical protein n=1 Tax=Streptomyces sp. NPDC001714 TaxID=3364603 RepID=UPI00368F3F7F